MKKYVILGLIVILSFALRAFNAKEYFLYTHDNDLSAWIVKDILVNGHARLIGQETSSQGIFIGSLFYYLSVPFFVLFKMSPASGLFLPVFLGVFGTASYYFVFSKVYSHRVGLFASFIHAVAYYVVFNEREVVPTMSVFIWCVWYYYALELILAGRQRAGFALFALMAALTWHISLGLGALFPLGLIALFLSGKKLDWRAVLIGIVAVALFFSPLILFEVKTNFLQTRALLSSFGGVNKDIIKGSEKLERVFQIISVNYTNMLWGPLGGVTRATSLALVLIALVFVRAKGILNSKRLALLLAWIILLIIAFSRISIVLSEYYLNATIFVLIWILALALANIKYWQVFVLIILFANLYRFATYPVNRSGYIDRSALVRGIKEDAKAHGYPCIAISFITNPGYDLGYRYLFYYEGMHVNKPPSGSPVYTIVFPLNDKVFKVDKTYGALGLIYPEYRKYSESEVKISCSGQNSNLTDSMFGYTE